MVLTRLDFVYKWIEAGMNMFIRKKLASRTYYVDGTQLNDVSKNVGIWILNARSDGVEKC